MSAAYTVLDAAAAEIRNALPKLRECEIHDGRFDAAEIKAFVTRAPAVRLACLGYRDAQDIGDGTEWRHGAMMAAYCVTTDSQGRRRGPAVITIVETVLAVVSGSRFGLDAERVGEAAQPRALNLYSRKVGAQGIALWAVEWLQPVTIAVPNDGSGLVPFETYHADWVLDGRAPDGPLPVDAPDATNTVSLQGDQT